jgi:hypothetical protein
MTARRLAQVAAIAGLFVGCGGGGGGTPLTETEFCKQKAEAECVVTDRCVTSKTDCEADRRAVCTQFIGTAKANGKRLFVAGNVGACINKAKSVYGKASAITPTELADLDDVCNYVFQGKGKVNEDNCDTKYDCASKVICDKTFCATQKTVNTGCGNPGDTCPTGNYCALNSASLYVCTAKGDADDMCDAATPCKEALRCAGTTCGDRVAAGATCASNADCPTSAPFCDPYAGFKCDPGLSFAAGSPSCADFGGSGSGPGTGGSGGGAGGTGGGAGGSGGGAGGRGGAGGGAGGRGGAGGTGGSGGSGGGAGSGGGTSGGTGGGGGGAGSGGSGGAAGGTGGAGGDGGGGGTN